MMDGKKFMNTDFKKLGIVKRVGSNKKGSWEVVLLNAQVYEKGNN